MKKVNTVLSLLTMSTMMFSLTACSVDVSRLLGPKAEEEIVVVEAEMALTEAQKEIKRLEKIYASGQFEVSDVKTLAKLYKEEGLVKKSRDLYEVAYRIYEDEEALTELSVITVNLAEEEAQIVETVDALVTNMETSEYYVEALNTLYSDEWFLAMMPKMRVGQRNYYGEDETGTLLQICVFYDENGAKNSRVFLEKAGQIFVLSKEGNQLQIMETGVQDGVYEGAFLTWTLNTDTGEVIREEGTYVGGNFKGDYKISIAAGDGQTDLASMWNLRDELIMTTYYGNFGENGEVLVEQQDDASVIIYAYTEDGKKYLSLKAPLDDAGTPIEAVNYSFGAQTFGLPAVPKPEKYDIQIKDADMALPGEENIPTIKPTEEPKVAVSDLQVRIFDGEIQIFDGKQWVSFGTAESYAKEDIIAVMEATNATPAPTAGVSDESGKDAEPTVSPTSGRDQGVVATPTPKPTKKPVATPKPTKAPVQATPVPTQAPSGGGSSSGGSSSGGSSGSSTPSQPSTPSEPSQPSTPSEPNPPADSGNSGGGGSDGSDIEDWTENDKV